MELNQSKQSSAEVPAHRFADIQQATERRNAELRATVERVQDASSERRERAEEMADNRRAQGRDRIDLSGAARAFTRDVEDGAERAERLEELKAAAKDGSLFDRDRLARAAERLLAE